MHPVAVVQLERADRRRQKSTEIPYPGVGRSGWWVAEQICGFVETFNPSKQEAKGGGVTSLGLKWS